MRAIAAAEAELDAGAPDTASKLPATAEMGQLDDLQRAGLERLRARLAFCLTRGSGALPLLLHAARRLVPLDAGVARETYLDALGAAIFAGRLNSCDAAQRSWPLRQRVRRRLAGMRT
jgi:hypothetical protein